MKTQTPLITDEQTAPTKHAEIAILQDAARLLGPLSYCGPWLAQQIAGIEQDIRSDFFPQIDLEACKTRCGDMLTAANDRASEIVTSAQRQAEAILRKAEKDAEQTRHEVASAIQRAQQAITRW